MYFYDAPHRSISIRDDTPHILETPQYGIFHHLIAKDTKFVQICVARRLLGSPTSTVAMPHTMALINLERFQVHTVECLLPHRYSLVLGQEQRPGF